MTYGYGAPAAGAGCGDNYGGWGIRWIYALLILIVIVLQFGRNDKHDNAVVASACGDTVAAGRKGSFDDQLIDNSVLFIIVVFLLILCAGCWIGGYANFGAAGSPIYGYGGYGY